MTKTVAEAQAEKRGIRKALNNARMSGKVEKPYIYPIQQPVLMPGVVPSGEKAPVMAQDGDYGMAYNFVRSGFDNLGFIGFPGYPYLASLSTRAEYRMFAQSMSSQVTREWIVLNSTESAGTETKDKITRLTQDITELGLRDIVAQMVEQ